MHVIEQMKPLLKADSLVKKYGNITALALLYFFIGIRLFRRKYKY
jgi:hypothetical protein